MEKQDWREKKEREKEINAGGKWEGRKRGRKTVCVKMECAWAILFKLN